MRLHSPAQDILHQNKTISESDYHRSSGGRNVLFDFTLIDRHRFDVPGTRWLRDTTRALANCRSKFMSEEHAPPLVPPLPEPPLCDQCRRPMTRVTTVPRVTMPGRVSVFECEVCEKIDLRSEA